MGHEAKIISPPPNPAEQTRAYQYTELFITEAREWVFEKAADKTTPQRIGTTREQLWERLHELAAEGWRVAAVYPVKSATHDHYLAYLLELSVPPSEPKP